MSFLKAVDPSTWSDPIVTPDEYEILVAGKSGRATATFTPDMIKYNILENEVLARLMQRLNLGYVDMGVRLKRHQWIGPGQAAQEWLNLIKAPLSKSVEEVTPVEVISAARASYYGGWFEIPTHGHVPGPSYEYDLNSAYPAVIQSLPCLLHGQWVETLDLMPNRRMIYPWQLVYGTFRGTNPFLGAHMHRDEKNCISRRDTKGWIWRHELDAAKAAGLVSRVEVERVYTYHPCNCLPPFRAIASLYDDRLRVGKNTPEGKARKLVYNSCYGKLSQSIGHPMFANPIYASLITSGCRTSILRAIATHPRKAAAVIMIATDAVYFTSPHPTLKISNKLGEWDCTVRNNICIMMPGVYWDDKSRQTINEGKTPTLKSRGVSGKYLAQVVAEMDFQWSVWNPSSGVWPHTEIEIGFAVTSAKHALARNRWDLCGHVSHNEIRSLSANPRTKREPASVYWYVGKEPIGRWMTKPYQQNPYDEVIETKPYDKTVGMSLESMMSDLDVMTVECPFNLEEALEE
jgi:hypothetical protein